MNTGHAGVSVVSDVGSGYACRWVHAGLGCNNKSLSFQPESDLTVEIVGENLVHHVRPAVERRLGCRWVLHCAVVGVVWYAAAFESESLEPSSIVGRHRVFGK